MIRRNVSGIFMRKEVFESKDKDFGRIYLKVVEKQ